MSQKAIRCTQKTPSTLVRPQYSPGLLLNDDDLTLAVDYTRSLNRLLFRSLLGSGVIAGLVVKHMPDSDKLKLFVTVEPGMALDPHGDPLHLIAPATIVVEPTCGSKLPPQLWVLARRYDRQCLPRGAVCSPENDDAASAYTRLQDGVEIGVYSELPPCVNYCTPLTPKSAPVPAPAANQCNKQHYDGIYNAGHADDGHRDWLVLAQLNKNDDNEWSADHSVRRFIRPALIADPQVALEHV